MARAAFTVISFTSFGTYGALPMKLWCPRDTATVLVIGSPGHGKSTFLNEFSDADEELFETGATGSSCTKNVSSKIITSQYDDGSAQGRLFTLNLVDSPGFPDPDKTSAIAMYDNVVTAATAPLNAIVWLVKGERIRHSIFAEYKMLMREFNNVQPPIFMVVNGQQSYTKKDEKQGKKEKDYKDLMEYGQACAEHAGVVVERTFVSTTKSNLFNVSQQVFMAALNEAPKGSKLKTFKQLEKELKELKDVDAWVRNEQQKLKEAITKAELSKKNNQDAIKWATGILVAASAASIAFPITAPWVGPVSTAALVMLQEELGEQNKQMDRTISASEKKRKELPNDLRESVEEVRNQVRGLFQALTGEARHDEL